MENLQQTIYELQAQNSALRQAERDYKRKISELQALNNDLLRLRVRIAKILET